MDDVTFFFILMIFSSLAFGVAIGVWWSNIRLKSQLDNAFESGVRYAQGEAKRMAQGLKNKLGEMADGLAQAVGAYEQAKSVLDEQLTRPLGKTTLSTATLGPSQPLYLGPDVSVEPEEQNGVAGESAHHFTIEVAQPV